MVRDNNINVRLEICKDKNSGKLSIRAHFDLNAPNVEMDKDGYIWMPTFEEKEFINEAFQLFPVNAYTPSKEKIQRTEEALNKKPFDSLPKIEKQKEPSVFQKTDDVENEHFEKNIFEKRVDIHNKRYESEREEPTDQEKETRRKEEKFILEADDVAIDAAIKRHLENDKSFVEVDEQTIIDKVLNQKKKGKLNNKY